MHLASAMRVFTIRQMRKVAKKIPREDLAAVRGIYQVRAYL